jgi:hypothetical protein
MRGRQGNIMLMRVIAFDVTVATISKFGCIFKYIAEVDAKVISPRRS